MNERERIKRINRLLEENFQDSTPKVTVTFEQRPAESGNSQQIVVGGINLTTYQVELIPRKIRLSGEVPPPRVRFSDESGAT